MQSIHFKTCFSTKASLYLHMKGIILQLLKTQQVTFLTLLPVTKFVASVATYDFESSHQF